MSDEFETENDSAPLPIFSSVRSRTISFYLSGELREPSAYTDWFHVIRNASPNDEIKIHINSNGGNGSTVTQFLRVLAETPAEVTASVEGDCMSAATMIFLAADRVEVSPHSIFLFHNYSGGAIGKGSDVYGKVSHLQRWSEELLRDVYKGFFSEEELVSILNGKDMWMDNAEVATRLKRRADFMKKENKSKR